MYCHKCGSPNDDSAFFCDRCGTALQKSGPETGAPAPTYFPAVEYAGFWRRLAASVIDGVLLTIAFFAAVFTIEVIYAAITGYEADEVPESTTNSLVYMAWAATLILGWLYYVAMESSTKQATLGKMALGIVVTDMKGQRVSFGRATGRYSGKIVSGIILCIGYFIVAFTEKRQGLHDIMADCLVVVKR